MKKMVTLKQVAEASGFTINTVSRALKDKADISYKTKLLIKKIAKEMGYVPDGIAGALRTGKSKIIGTIITDVSDPMIAIWVKEIEAKLSNLGYSTILMNTNENYDLEKEAIYICLNKKVDGILLIPTQQENDDIKYLKNLKIPFVLIGRYFKNIETDYVVADDIKGGYLASKFLLNKGHKKILFLNGPQYNSGAANRYKGFMSAFKEYNLNFPKELYIETAITAGDIEGFLNKLIKNKIKFSSIFTFSDLKAWEVIYWLKKMNYKVPEEIEVVGYDNIQSKFYFPYTLTTIGYSHEKIIDNALNILFKKINSKSEGKNYLKVVVDTELVIGDSTI